MIHTARPNARPMHRPAFTLVELLVVMGVLALMSSMVLVGLASAAEQARVARTRAQVQKIHQLLMTRWEDYRYRRVEIDRTGGSVRARQALRVDMIRDLMRMEMPDRKADFGYEDTSGGLIYNGPVQLSSKPALYSRYERQIISRTGGTDMVSALNNWSALHAQAECLYIVLESIQDGEANGLDYFKSSEIGDVDGDGMPEILDAWGNPIYFLRWPYGFPYVETEGSDSLARRDTLTSLIDLDSTDPFDPLNVRGGATHPALYPLVVSAGPNGLYNLRMDIDDYEYTVGMSTVRDILCYQRINNNPYASSPSVSNPREDRIGNIINDSGDELDNITNHVLVIPGNS